MWSRRLLPLLPTPRKKLLLCRAANRVDWLLLAAEQAVVGSFSVGFFDLRV